MIPVSSDDLVIIHQGDEDVGPAGKWCRKTRHWRRATNAVNRLILYAAKNGAPCQPGAALAISDRRPADNGVRHFMN